MGAFHGLFSEVQWSPGYVGLLLYVFTTVTYRLPLAVPAIVLALGGVFLSGNKIRLPGFLVAFAAFIVWGVIGMTQSSYAPVVSERLILLVKLWLIAFAAVNTLRTPAQVRFLLVFFLVCFATHPARGAIFNYFYGYTLFGRALWNHTYANPNDLAALTLFPLALAVALVRDPDRWIRRGALISVVVLMILILMTQSRGVFLALVLVTVLFWQTQRRKLRALLLVAVFGAAAAAIAPGGVWDRVATLTSEGTEADTSSQQRWEVWQIASAISKGDPLFGVGYGAYARAHQQYTMDSGGDWLSGGYRDAHSTYMSLLAEAGWPGLLMFLLMVALPLMQAVRTRTRLERWPAANETLSSVALGLVGFMAAGVFATYHHLAFLYLNLALMTVLCTIYGTPRIRPTRHGVLRRRELTPGT
jgi:putative inorganic carbon (hco3(-)) transporter